MLYLFGGAEQITLNVSAKTWTGLRNITGPDGTTVTRSSTGTVTYQVANGQGTAITAVDASTLAVTRRAYDPWGNPRGTKPTSFLTPDENHGFLGQPADPTTGLNLLGARNYDPITGRFLTPDPVFEPGDPNQMGGYTYAGDNPASSADPSGLMLMMDGVGGGCKSDCAAANDKAAGVTTTSSGKQKHHHSSGGCSGFWGCAGHYFHKALPVAEKVATVVAVVAVVVVVVVAVAACTETVVAAPACAMAASEVVGAAGGFVGGADCMAMGCGGGEPIGGEKADSPPSAGGAGGAGEAPKASADAAPHDAGSGSGDAAAASGAGKESTKDSAGTNAAAPKKASSQDEASASSRAAAAPDEPSTGNSGTTDKGSSGGGTRCSFSPETPVLMAGGKTKAIGKIKTGDKVEAADPKTGKHHGARAVQHIWINHDKDLLDVTVRDKRGHTATLHTTANHPFWDDTTHSWKQAGDLPYGDALNTADSGHAYVVTSRVTPGTANRWNLTVQELHTYYVVARGTPVLVHNTDGESCTIPKTVYRGDGRSPAEIRNSGGFHPQDPSSGRSLLDYASDIRHHSRFVGTSKNAGIAATYFGGREGYVYEITGAPGGIDVNEELGALSPSPHEKEIAFDGGVPWEYVTRVWQKDEWGEIDFEYDEPIWERE
ncbi:polymorphic toxin-type HINT domain-containing protein [Streptomyces sp. NPDC048489]|uniref:polymorphic toxin-type HINT domain-containing protein n=1 Tax=Streptomyces sp. NPDC048489 TaxID=3154504 RepID=UPI00343E8D21